VIASQSVRQVVGLERIQGVIEAKLIPAQLPPVTTIQSAYPGLGYQAAPFCPAQYHTVSPPQVVYASPAATQPTTAVQRNVSSLATTNTPPTVEIYDTKRKCLTCGSEQHLLVNCPNKIPRTVEVAKQVSTSNNQPQNDANEICKYCKKTGHNV